VIHIIDKTQCTGYGPIALAIILAAIVFSGAFYFAPSKAAADTAAQQQPHLLSVSSDATQEVSPDKVEIIFAVVSRGKDPTAVQEENDAKLRTIQEKLLAMGVPADNIKTVGYSLNRWNEYNKTQETYVDMGYELRNSLRVVSYNTKLAGSIVKEAVSNGANEMQGIQFGLSDATRDRLYSQLLQKAAAQAKQKASDMASSAGVSIKGLSQMSEGYRYVAPMANYALGGMDAKSAPEVSISEGLVSVQATVTAAYEIAG